MMVQLFLTVHVKNCMREHNIKIKNKKNEREREREIDFIGVARDSNSLLLVK